MKKLLMIVTLINTFSMALAANDPYEFLKSIDGKSIFELSDPSLKYAVYNCGVKIIEDMDEMDTQIFMTGGNKLETIKSTQKIYKGWSKSFGFTWNDIKAILGNSDSILPDYYKVKWSASTDSYDGEITRIYNKNCIYIRPIKEEILDFRVKWNER